MTQSSPPPWIAEAGAYETARLAWFKANGAVFRPASGYVTQSGCQRWRVYADPIDGSGAYELCDKRGFRRLFASYQAAKRAADRLNA